MEIVQYLLITGWLLLTVGCSLESSSRIELPGKNESKRDERILVLRQENARYKLSVLFYKDPAYKSSQMTQIHDLPNVMVFRDDEKGEELQTIELAGDGYLHTEVWSPDKEYLLLRCENYSRFCIYKASALRQQLKPGNIFDSKSADDYVGDIIYTEIYPPDKGIKSDCSLGFMRWEGENAFVFVAGTGGKNGRSAFKYNIGERRIYSAATRLNNKLGLDYGFEAANKNGRLQFVKE